MIIIDYFTLFEMNVSLSFLLIVQLNKAYNQKKIQKALKSCNSDRNSENFFEIVIIFKKQQVYCIILSVEIMLK